MRLRLLIRVLELAATLCYSLGLIRAGNRVMDHVFYARNRV